jgi:hypothetical protein
MVAKLADLGLSRVLQQHKTHRNTQTVGEHAAWYILLDSIDIVDHIKGRYPAVVHYRMVCIKSQPLADYASGTPCTCYLINTRLLLFAAALHTAAGTMRHMAPEVSCCVRYHSATKQCFVQVKVTIKPCFNSTSKM